MCKVALTNIATFASHTQEGCTMRSRKRGLIMHSLKKSVDQKKITQKTIEKK